MVAIDASKLRHGRVRGRYFRENFAQAGIDLAQIIPELVTNADAAIAAARARARPHRPSLRPARPGLPARRGSARLRALRVPALRGWRYELVCADDGVGRRRRRRRPAARRARRRSRERAGSAASSAAGCATSGSRRAAAGSRASAAAGRSSRGSFPCRGDEPVRLRARARRQHAGDPRELGIAREGTRVTVPLADGRLPPNARLRTARRPTSCSCGRCSRTRRASCCSSCPASRSQLVALPPPEPDPERPLLFDDEIEVAARRPRARDRRAAAARADPAEPVAGDARAAVWSSARGEPRTRRRSPASRATPGARHLYGEVRCEAIERLQREALDAPRPAGRGQVDRSGLNEHHPLVQACTRRSSACCARSSTPRSGAPARDSCAPGGRCARATRSGCARSTTRCGPRSTRPGRPASRAAARPPSSRRVEERRAGAPSTTAAAALPARDAALGGGDALQAVAGAPASGRAAQRLAADRPGARAAGNADRGRLRRRLCASLGSRWCRSRTAAAGRA